MVNNKEKKEYSNNFKKIRLSKKMTQKQFSEYLGLQRTSISMIENGKRYPSFRKHLAFCSKLKLNYLTEFPYFKKDIEILNKNYRKLLLIVKQIVDKDKIICVCKDCTSDCSLYKLKKILKEIGEYNYE